MKGYIPGIVSMLILDESGLVQVSRGRQAVQIEIETAQLRNHHHVKCTRIHEYVILNPAHDTFVR